MHNREEECYVRECFSFGSDGSTIRPAPVAVFAEFWLCETTYTIIYYYYIVLGIVLGNANTHIYIYIYTNPVQIPCARSYKTFTLYVRREDTLLYNTRRRSAGTIAPKTSAVRRAYAYARMMSRLADLLRSMIRRIHFLNYYFIISIQQIVSFGSKHRNNLIKTVLYFRCSAIICFAVLLITRRQKTNPSDIRTFSVLESKQQVHTHTIRKCECNCHLHFHNVNGDIISELYRRRRSYTICERDMTRHFRGNTFFRGKHTHTHTHTRRVNTIYCGSYVIIICVQRRITCWRHRSPRNVLSELRGDGGPEGR